MVDNAGKGGAKYQGEQKKYPCDQCEYSAGKLDHLKRHKEIKHEGIKYPCDQCSYAATTSGHLKTHKQRKH